MARALCTHAFHFPLVDREQVLAGLRARRAELKGHGLNYWVFEDPKNPGIIIEFLEGPDVDTLTKARRAVGETRGDLAILSEVEF